MKIKREKSKSKMRLLLVMLLVVISQVVSAESREYWINKYLSVSYPLRSIRITSAFGKRRDPFSGHHSAHKGLDMSARYEEALSMFDGGIVTKVEKDSRAGLYVTIRYGSYSVSYCHLHKSAVLVGDTLYAGDIVGITGSSGRSTGPHLHLTSRKDGVLTDPYNLLLYIHDVRMRSYIALGGKIQGSMNPDDFFSVYAPIAMQQQQKYGIPASVTLAQMAYESGWGGSELSRKGNNYFGIKANKTWIEDGRAYSLHDDDKPNEAFCNYSSVEESVEHHSLLLMSDRYKRCHRHSSTDYHGWLTGLKAAGYATARNYVKSCEKIIKRYHLYLYDREALNA